MALHEQITFVREFLSNLRTVGAVVPVSRYAAAALGSELARRRGPKRVLEVGAGTGAVTASLVRQIQPGDAFVVCELNATFAAYLHQRFAQEAPFQRVADQTTVIEGDMLELPTADKFDFIVATIPFNNCPPEFVVAAFAHFAALLKPGGVLSYIEYIGGRTIQQTVRANPSTLELQRLLAKQRRAYEFRRERIWRNGPPAWVHHLRFSQAAAESATTLQPRAHDHRLAWGGYAVDSDALPWVGGLAGLALWLRQVAPARNFWQLPALAAPLVALFLRDPARTTPPDPHRVYAASDGTVLAVEKLYDERFGPEEWLRIVVFLSILDVHLNRAPVAGKVVAILQEAGGFAAANSGAAEHNQAQYTIIESTQGRCVVAQRVGLIARRIVNRSRVGDLLAQGEKFGLIRFGSRTDVYLPAAQVQPVVVPGEVVRGGETVLARFVK